MDEIIKIIHHALKQASIDHTVNAHVDGAQFNIEMDNGFLYSVVVKQDTPLNDILNTQIKQGGLGNG